MSIVNELRAEIVRQARKEINKQLEPVKRVNATQRGLIANLRRDLVALQKEVAQLRKAVPEAVRPAAPSEEERQGFWISGKGVLSLRKKLGLTQIEFAKLADITQQTVVRWEKTEGKIPVRGESTIARMIALRTMGKREARAKLEAFAEQTAAVAPETAAAAE